jgi:hypothetical protein
LESGKKNSVDLRTWLSLSAEIVAEFMAHNGMFCGHDQYIVSDTVSLLKVAIG